MNAARDLVRARLVALAGTDADPSRDPRNELAQRVRHLVADAEPLSSDHEQGAQVDDVLREIDGVGALADVLAEPGVTDVMVNGDGSVWIEQHGVLSRSNVVLGIDDVLRAIERIVLPLGLRADRANPTVDARLIDGTRVHVVLPPLSRPGPVVTFRRFHADTLQLSAFGSPAVVEVVARLIDARRTVLVCGATGSGKTSLVRSMCHHIPADQRIVVVEDLAELAVQHPHCVELESRPANSDGKGAVGMRELLRNALRMRPDRLVVGEVRGGEAFDLLQALHTGHEGSMATLHANTCDDALDRFEALVLLANVGVAVDAVRRQLASAVHAVIRVERGVHGDRRIVELVAVVREPSHGLGRRIVHVVRDGVVVHEGDAPTGPAEPTPALMPFRSRISA